MISVVIPALNEQDAIAGRQGLLQVSGDDGSDINNRSTQIVLLLSQTVLADDILCRKTADTRIESASIGKTDNERDFVRSRRIRR